MYRHASTCLSGQQDRSRAGDQGYETAESPAATSAGRVSRSATRETDSPMRLDLIARVRQEIADGTYDTPDRWETALDRLAGRLDLA